MAEKKNKAANIDVLGNIYNNILKGLSLGKTLIMLQGGGRCFAAGTKIRMYDGSLKNIEDIAVGDKVMNADGRSFSNVTETHSGIGQLYRIHPNKSECDYLVNGEHILTLKQTEAFSKKIDGKHVRVPFDRDKIIDISVKDFIAKSAKWKSKYSLFKNTLIDLPKRDLRIDPYYLGYWLGNGSSSKPYFISTAEQEIVEWFSKFAYNLKVPIYKISECKYDYAMEICETGTRNLRKRGAIRDFCDMFRYYKLINNKHIPSDYIYGSYDDRLKLLAGLIDSDGYNTRRRTIGITQKDKQISESIVEICRLSGFYTNGIKSKIAKCKRKDGSVYKCRVYTIEINHNDFNDLNKYIKVPRKRIHKNCDRDYYVTHFTITKDEIGRYYGFTLDKSPYFMDYQGIVFHNSGKTYNTMIFLVLQCLNSIKKVSIVRQSLPVIKRSVLEDFKTIMRQMGQWDDRRFNKTDCIYYFPNGSVMEFFSAEDEQKLRGPSRDILYANEANEISYYAFSNLRMRTYGYCIVDYNPSFTEEHWLFPLMTDERTYFFKSTFKDNIFLPQAARDEIMSYKETNPALWKIYGEGEFAIIDGLVFPKENWDIIPDEEFPTWLGEEYLGIDWGFVSDPTVCVGAIVNDTDIYVREYFRETGLKTKDIAQRLEPYRDRYKYCDIDNRLVSELEDAGIPLLTMTRKNGESIMTGIRLMNQRHIHIVSSSTELIKEFRNYVYKKDRHETYQTNLRPIDKFNHGIDALRYIVYAECSGCTNDDTRGFSKEELGIFM